MARFHIILGFVVCFVAWIFFLCFPHLDITLASNFYNSGDNLFTGQSVLFFTFINKFVRVFPIVFSILVTLFLLGSLFIKVWQTKYRKEIFFVLMCLIIGPGLIVNTIFKDHWGRPRPQMVKQFDGDKNFQQPFVISSECSSNCSFVCGDASVGFWLFAFMPLMATRKKRAIAFSIAILAGGALGLMRMAQGGHFFSDVVFCGVFVYISTWVIYAIMYRDKFKKS